MSDYLALYEVGVVGQFEAAHSLKGDFGPATGVHGHTYRVEAAVRGHGLSTDGVLTDITELQSALDHVLAGLNYRNLDEVEELAHENTTAEVMARHLAQGIARRTTIPEPGSLRVTVWESPRAYAAYEMSAPRGVAHRGTPLS